MPADITSIQPGGGFCMACELAWGRLRRGYLRAFRRRYIARMRKARQGASGAYPHEILDPRDLKFHANQGAIHWAVADDPFTWRDRLPVVRVGLAEILIVGGGLAVAFALLLWWYWPVAGVPLVMIGFVVWFFRDPKRHVPTGAGLVVSPADGRVFSIRAGEHDDLLGAETIVVDIFLSVFNVHINRVPFEGRVTSLTYRRGKFLNALRPEAARENESLELRLQSTAEPYRVARVRQITGAIARRIVCWAKPGDHLSSGAQFGMIKFGSRTELTIPKEPGLELRVETGQRVRAGSTIIAHYTLDGAVPVDAG